MLTLTVECEVEADHTAVLRLPRSVLPGRHRIALVVDPEQERSTSALVTPLSGESPGRAEVWERLMALRDQAIDQGMALMSWDEVNAEVQSR